MVLLGKGSCSDSGNGSSDSGSSDSGSGGASGGGSSSSGNGRGGIGSGGGMGGLVDLCIEDRLQQHMEVKQHIHTALSICRNNAPY